MSGYGQLKLVPKDFDNLIALGELYSHNNMFSGEEFAKAANALRTPILDHVIDAMIESGKADTLLLQNRFMARPTNEELTLWYVIREIHYNRIDTTKKPSSDIEIAQKVLSDNTNEKWLLDNYYYLVEVGISFLFNNADLSHFNFDLNNLGLKNKTEKDIFFLHMMHSLTYGRFRVLNYMKKHDKIIEMSNKLPLFDDKKYFYYSSFNLSDDEWTGYLKGETYKRRYIGGLLEALLIQLSTIASMGDKPTAREIYSNSILSKPEYFKYSGLDSTLQKIYDNQR
jgi:hypothetical protein